VLAEEIGLLEGLTELVGVAGGPRPGQGSCRRMMKARLGGEQPRGWCDDGCVQRMACAHGGGEEGGHGRMVQEMGWIHGCSTMQTRGGGGG